MIFLYNGRMKSIEKNSVSITEGVIWKQLLLFFFPILFGTFFQQLYNTVDAIIVGRFLGKEALSAVGGGSGTIINLLVGFFTGLSSGASVIISQFYGAKNHKDLQTAVHTALALSAAGGILIGILGFFTAPFFLELLGTPEEIKELAAVYLRIYFAGAITLTMYNMGAGILRAVGDSKRPFYFLVVSTVTNILLDFLFIAVFRMGVEGAALATVLSQLVSMFCVLTCLSRTREPYRFILKEMRMHPAMLRRTVQIGFPAGIQSAMYTISNLIIQANINSFGTNTIAGWAAFGKIDSLYWMTINSFGIAITTFAGQNYGAGKTERIRKGVASCFKMAAVSTIVISGLFVAFGRYILLLFTDDAAVLEEGVKMINYIAPTFITFISIEILSGAIRGTGKALIPTMMTCGGVCLFRILWLGGVVTVFHTVGMVCASYPISWILTSILFIVYYSYLSRRDFKTVLKN